MNKLILFLFSVVLLMSSCGKGYKIEGTSSLAGLDGKTLFIKTLKGEEWIKLDSAEIVHGLFSMKGNVDTVAMTTLFMEDEGIMPLVLEKGKIEISIAYPQFTAKGTPMNDALYGFLEKRNDLELQVEELHRKEARMVMEGGNIDEIQAQLDVEAEKLKQEINTYIKSFISQNYENVLGPNVFVMLCSSLPYPVLTPQIEDILNDAPYSFKNHVLVKEFVTVAKENMRRIKEQQLMENVPAERN